MARQGPHQVAQKSTKNGSLEPATSELKFWSVTSIIFFAIVATPFSKLLNTANLYYNQLPPGGLGPKIRITMKFIVNEPARVMDLLVKQLKLPSLTKARNLVKEGSVQVDGEVIDRAERIVNAGQTVQ